MEGTTRVRVVARVLVAVALALTPIASMCDTIFVRPVAAFQEVVYQNGDTSVKRSRFATIAANDELVVQYGIHPVTMRRGVTGEDAVATATTDVPDTGDTAEATGPTRVIAHANAPTVATARALTRPRRVRRD
jgi:hypothetical protein